MKQSDYEQFEVILSAAAEMYNKTLAPMTIALWWKALEIYDIDAVRDGMTRYLQNPDTGQFMPKPADVVRMIGGSTQDSALFAWSKVDKALRSVGVYSSVVFDDPIIHAVLVDMGGMDCVRQQNRKGMAVRCQRV